MIVCSISVKIVIELLIVIAMNLKMALSSTHILTIVFQIMNMEYLSIYFCLLQCLLSLFYSFQCKDTLPSWLNSFWSILFYLFLFIYFVYLFLAALGLHCCVWAFSSCGEWGLLFVAVCRLLIEMASIVVDHRLCVCGLQ